MKIPAKKADMPVYMELLDGSIRRMDAFTVLRVNIGAIEYTRQYIDEAHPRTRLIGSSASVRYAFDRFVGDPVHNALASASDALDAEEVRLYFPDMLHRSEVDGEATYRCVRCGFTHIPDIVGADTEMLTYSGCFKACGEPAYGNATVSTDGRSISFTEE